MAEIRILPEHVVNQIAAGEVVERASSVLKELVENALDASATRIQITAKGQGRELLQVVDDGCGMARGDLYLAFERHATSKLARPEDLFAITTLGFRGEALPSIASVSFIEIRSRAETGDTGGTLLRIEGGTISHESRIAAPQGHIARRAFAVFQHAGAGALSEKRIDGAGASREDVQAVRAGLSRNRLDVHARNHAGIQPAGGEPDRAAGRFIRYRLCGQGAGGGIRRGGSEGDGRAGQAGTVRRSRAATSTCT